ncbi:MAG: hypothetical protein LBS59_02930 [Puniceicoccales bacterium]|nr:hypothetical protein [Puniceicoccales bacterium]
MPRCVPASIGFPPPLLGRSPVRLPVLAARDGVFALEKPAAIAWEGPAGVEGAVRSQLAAGKTELVAIAPTRSAVSVWPLEADMAGIGLFVPHGEEFARWRNAYGSALIRFTYAFLAVADAGIDDVFTCAAPITGRKSATLFRRMERAARWTWWEAETDYPRFQQIRKHAAMSGLRIVGETSPDAEDAVLTLEMLLPRKRLNKGIARPLIDGICLRLACVDCSRAKINAWGAIRAPLPPKWEVLRKRLAAASVLAG